MRVRTGALAAGTRCVQRMGAAREWCAAAINERASVLRTACSRRASATGPTGSSPWLVTLACARACDAAAHTYRVGRQVSAAGRCVQVQVKARRKRVAHLIIRARSRMVTRSGMQAAGAVERKSPRDSHTCRVY